MTWCRWQKVRAKLDGKSGCWVACCVRASRKANFTIPQSMRRLPSRSPTGTCPGRKSNFFGMCFVSDWGSTFVCCSPRSITRNCALAATRPLPPWSSKAALWYITNLCNCSCNKTTRRRKCNGEDSFLPELQLLPPTLTHRDPDLGTILEDRMMPTKFKYQKCKFLQIYKKSPNIFSNIFSFFSFL